MKQHMETWIWKGTYLLASQPIHHVPTPSDSAFWGYRGMQGERDCAGSGLTLGDCAKSCQKHYVKLS